MALPVLDTRQVLLNHLLSKLTAICSTKLAAKKILLEVSNNLQNKDILRLLEDDKLLTATVNKFHARTAEKEELGELLYYKIKAVEPDLCSKITGMLMELDTATIKKLLDDHSLLQNAIDKSKKEYLEFTSNSKKRQEYGEQIYNLVCKYHTPDLASRLTGMLLELDEESLQILLTNHKEFEKKLEIAYNTFITYCSS